MKYRLLILTVAMVVAVPFAFACAEEDPSNIAPEATALQKIAPEAGGKAADAEEAGDFSVQQKLDAEEASWMKGTIFDSEVTGGTVQDPATLQRRPYLGTPNKN